MKIRLGVRVWSRGSVQPSFNCTEFGPLEESTAAVAAVAAAAGTPVYNLTQGMDVLVSLTSSRAFDEGNVTLAITDMCLDHGVSFTLPTSEGTWPGLSTTGLANHVDCGGDGARSYGLASDWVGLWTSAATVDTYFRFAVLPADPSFNASIRVVPRGVNVAANTCSTASLWCPNYQPNATSEWFLATPGQQVFVVVDGRTTADHGEFTLMISSTRTLPGLFCWYDATRKPLCIDNLYGYVAGGVGLGVGFLVGFLVPKGSLFATAYIVCSALVMCLLVLPFSLQAPMSSLESGTPFLASVQPYAALVFTTAMVVAVALGWYVSTWTTTLMAYDLQTKSVRRIFTWRLEWSRTVIISWRWDIKSAVGWESQSRILQLCVRRAQALGFKYMLVDVVTLDQNAINAAAVLYFVGSYARFPVLVGIDSAEERSAYGGRFWCQYEMFKYRENSHVFTLDDGTKPVPTSPDTFHLLQSSAVRATYNLDRVRVFILSMPFGTVLGTRTLGLIRDAARDKQDVSVDMAAAVIAHANRYLAGELQKPLFDMATTHGVLGYPLLLVWFLAMLLGLPPLTREACQDWKASWVGGSSDDEKKDRDEFFETAKRLKKQDNSCVSTFVFWCGTPGTFLGVIVPPALVGIFVVLSINNESSMAVFIGLVSAVLGVAVLSKVGRVIWQFEGLRGLLVEALKGGGDLVVGVHA